MTLAFDIFLEFFSALKINFRRHFIEYHVLILHVLQDDWDEIDTMMMALQCDIDLTQQTIRRPSGYNDSRGVLYNFHMWALARAQHLDSDILTPLM